MALLNHRYSISSSSSLPSICTHQFSTPLFFVITKQPQRKLTISLCSPTSTQSSPIFLPFLQNPGKKETHKPEHNNIEEINDPILKFFKTRTSEQGSEPDPLQEGRISLQKNRKTSWHLASTFDEPNSGDEMKSYHLGLPENVNSGLQTASEGEGIVGEILEIARGLPENVTLGEALEGYDFGGRIGEVECVEVLRIMGEEGMVMNCLYFFEWMGLNEPSLVSPRTCSVLFPILGRARKGNELLVVFRNLPFDQKKQFRDVRVYNAAISGLLSCGRFDDAWKVYNSLETDNIRPDHVTCSIMITIMRKSGSSAKDSWEFFEKMNKKGNMWSLEVLGALIKTFCDEGLKNEALVIQSEMEKRGISSNVVVYNTIMDAYGKSNQVEELEARSIFIMVTDHITRCERRGQGKDSSLMQISS
ncbi:unnamed protein product [Fraxinus pennsylvanica]|uniref:Pentatricopeptide repeat-containing protein n=1 Tax=Fraxinus pennsylvanica TaxID=56036 RepID=A0AAD2ED00_9LAMI|nr:unnamed protein product [Fraxinus pennsylvanica]